MTPVTTRRPTSPPLSETLSTTGLPNRYPAPHEATLRRERPGRTADDHRMSPPRAQSNSYLGGTHNVMGIDGHRYCHHTPYRTAAYSGWPYTHHTPIATPGMYPAYLGTPFQFPYPGQYQGPAGNIGMHYNSEGYVQQPSLGHNGYPTMPQLPIAGFVQNVVQKGQRVSHHAPVMSPTPTPQYLRKSHRREQRRTIKANSDSDIEVAEDQSNNQSDEIDDSALTPTTVARLMYDNDIEDANYTTASSHSSGMSSSVEIVETGPSTIWTLPLLLSLLARTSDLTASDKFLSTTMLKS
jgi:hypothetical protein